MKTIVIYGATDTGKNIYYDLMKEQSGEAASIILFFDDNPALWGQNPRHRY